MPAYQFQLWILMIKIGKMIWPILSQEHLPTLLMEKSNMTRGLTISYLHLHLKSFIHVYDLSYYSGIFCHGAYNHLSGAVFITTKFVQFEGVCICYI